MASVATLTIDLIGRSTKLQAELKKSTKNAKTWAQQTKAEISKVKNSMVALGALAGTSLAAFGLAENRLHELQRLSDISKESVENFRDYALAAKTVGIEEEKLADISKDTLEKLGEFMATGGGGFKDFFEQVAPKVGLTAKQLQHLSGPEVLIAVQKAMDDANVSYEKQSFYLESIASDTTNLIPLLKNQGKEFKNVSSESVTLTQNFSYFGDEVLAVIAEIDEKTKTSDGLSSWLEEITTRIKAARTGTNSLDSLQLKHEDLVQAIESRRLKGMPIDDLLQRLREVNQEIAFLTNSYVESVDEILSGTGFEAGAKTTVEQISEVKKATNDLGQTVSSLNIPSLLFDWDQGESSWEDTIDIPGFNEMRELLKTEVDREPISEIVFSGFDNVESVDWTSLVGVDKHKEALDQIANAQLQHEMLMNSIKTDFAASSIGLVRATAEEGTTLWKLALVAEKGLMVSKAIMQANLNATMAAAAQLAIPTPDAPIRAAAAAETARNWGYANAALIAATAIASFEGGGYIKDGIRAGGVDNKGGKLAVLHPDETVIDHKKDKGQSQPVKIENHFHGIGDNIENVAKFARRNANKIKSMTRPIT